MADSTACAQISLCIHTERVECPTHHSRSGHLRSPACRCRCPSADRSPWRSGCCSHTAPCSRCRRRSRDTLPREINKDMKMRFSRRLLILIRDLANALLSGSHFHSRFRVHLEAHQNLIIQRDLPFCSLKLKNALLRTSFLCRNFFYCFT